MILRCAMILLLAASSLAAESAPPPAENGPLFRIEEGGKWGFIDVTGKVVIKPQYDWCDR